MEATCFSSSSSKIPYRSCPQILKPPYTLMLKQDHVPMKKIPKILVRPPIINKVFEDPAQGIICYRDAQGEMVCEGYDEGPRSPTHTLREAKIVNLLQQKWFQIGKGGFSITDALQLQHDFKWEWN